VTEGVAPQLAAGTSASPWTFAGEFAVVEATDTMTLVSGSFVICRRSGDIAGAVDGVYLATPHLRRWRAP
jgi:hypothetical protein